MLGWAGRTKLQGPSFAWISGGPAAGGLPPGVKRGLVAHSGRTPHETEKIPMAPRAGPGAHRFPDPRAQARTCPGDAWVPPHLSRLQRHGNLRFPVSCQTPGWALPDCGFLWSGRRRHVFSPTSGPLRITQNSPFATSLEPAVEVSRRPLSDGIEVRPHLMPSGTCLHCHMPTDWVRSEPHRQRVGCPIQPGFLVQLL